MARISVRSAGFPMDARNASSLRFTAATAPAQRGSPCRESRSASLVTCGTSRSPWRAARSSRRKASFRSPPRAAQQAADWKIRARRSPSAEGAAAAKSLAQAGQSFRSYAACPSAAVAAARAGTARASRTAARSLGVIGTPWWSVGTEPGEDEVVELRRRLELWGVARALEEDERQVAEVGRVPVPGGRGND